MMSETPVNAAGKDDDKPDAKSTGGSVSSTSADRIRIAKIVAVVAGLIGIVIALLTPFLPCLLYTSPSPRDGLLSRMPSSA